LLEAQPLALGWGGDARVLDKAEVVEREGKPMDSLLRSPIPSGSLQRKRAAGEGRREDMGDKEHRKNYSPPFSGFSLCWAVPFSALTGIGPVWSSACPVTRRWGHQEKEWERSSRQMGNFLILLLLLLVVFIGD
jgi:hypothetical protein